MSLVDSPSPLPVSPPAVSVVIPCFNAGRFVTETIGSVLEQAYSSIELIVVDDGSTDDSREKVRRFGSAVRLLEQPNRGRSVARNRGLQEARGEFVVFLDSDDLLAPDHVRTLVDAMRRADCDLAYGRAEHFIDGEGTRVAFRRPCFEKDQALRIILDNFLPPPATVMLRRQFVTDSGVRFEPGRRCGEDWEFWIRLVLAGARVAFVDRVVALCREHASNTRRDLAAMDATVLQWFGELEHSHRDVIRRRGLADLFARGRNRIKFRLASVLVFLGRRREGRHMLFELASALSLLRPVDRARLPAVLLHSLVPVPLPAPVVRVVYGQHCALNRRFNSRQSNPVPVSAGEQVS